MTADFLVMAPGLKIEAWRAASPEALPFAGLLIEFDPSIPREMRGVSLESALRFWQRNVGSVKRGARADLAGWRVTFNGEGRIARMRLSYILEEKDAGQHAEPEGQPRLHHDDDGPGCP